ncbi:helicase DnaB [Pantoea alhagi]|uniref:DNA 5'-3' helicase n=1 Tax=Pantoea alhagi TaxID=1891675 RepID=A0A1W6B850_9GAMM|nr:DnaB-like helicase C-terminal domain-containing protein [Pantoea alhagi]ARJ43275.1 helicase DnaB [Pantoea alhagi]
MTADYKTPPHNTDAEQAVLGGIMLDGGEERSQKVLAMLKPESFYNKAHGAIFEAVRDLLKRNQPVDLLTVSDELGRRGQLEQTGGFAYLAEISKGVPSVANIVHYAAAVRDCAMERYAISKLAEATEMLYTRSTMNAVEKLEAVSTLTSQISDYAKTGNRRGARALIDVMDDWLREVEGRFDNTGAHRGLSTGIPSLDAMLEPKGLVKGSLFVIGARPKMGKTTLYSQMAINTAMREKLPAVLFSLEMPDKQIFERMVGQASGVNTDIFYRGSDNDTDFALANGHAMELVQSGNLFIDDTPGITLAHIVAESRRIKREKGAVGMVMVDYLTLMTGEKADRNDLSFGLITKGLKNLAKELGCVVVLLTQLNRDLEKRTNKRPLPSDSRDTGQIEQDCDYWLGIYREGAYDENYPQHETELLLRLNRHGKTGVVYAEQKNGAIYDADQLAYQAKAAEREAKPQKRGGF